MVESIHVSFIIPTRFRFALKIIYIVIKLNPMKKLLLLLVFLISTTTYSQTPLADANFKTAIATCLSTNPVDVMCSSSEYGAMPDWDVSDVTDMHEAFEDAETFNADLSGWAVSNVGDMSGMFSGASSFNADLSSWDARK